MPKNATSLNAQGEPTVKSWTSLLLVAGVAAIADVPTPIFAADLSYQSCRRIRLTCRGFEPNWSFTLPGNGTIRFLDPQSPNFPAPLVIQACATGSGSQINITAGAPLNLTATVTQQSCTEPSGQVRPRKITISYQQGAPGPGMQISGTGCCQ
jgi:hypothetical protein